MPALGPSQDEAPIFELDHLVIGFRTSARTTVTAVRGVSFAVHRGETLGIVGESGSGKSVSLMGAFGLLTDNAVQLGGTVRFAGRDVGAMPADERRGLLGKDVAFIFQNPVASLDPVLSIGAQLVEALRVHDSALGRHAAWQRAIGLLGRVGLDAPERRVRQFPHEFSGGMCQRVMIAMALANRPQVLIADEPTTAVDATIQAQILKLLRDLRAEVSGAVVLVSHDLGVIAENADHVVVMYAGRVMESGPTAAVLADPRHPYTQGLLACRPSLHRVGGLAPIPGNPPMLAGDPPGCAFQPRCPVGRDGGVGHPARRVRAARTGRVRGPAGAVLPPGPQDPGAHGKGGGGGGRGGKVTRAAKEGEGFLFVFVCLWVDWCWARGAPRARPRRARAVRG